ncbi:MAG: PQQ-binding-like beta-propeller repeat protein, partial [Candidatus Bathyarchaeia archaeon]
SLWVVGASNIWQVDPWTGSTLFLWSGVSGSYHKGALYLTNYNGTKGTAETGTMTKWDTRTRATVWTAKIPSVTLFWDDILIRRSSSTGGIPYGLQLWTYNATTGKVIVDGVSYGSEVYSAEITFVAGYGKYFQHGVDGRTRAFSLYDGKIVWESEPMSMPWGSFAAYAASCGLGMVFEPSHDGYLYAYDVETGQLKWKAFTEKTTETAMGVYGTWSQIIIADGKVYFSVGEHTPPNPMPRGGKLYCVNATNGELIWSLEGFYQKAGTTRYGGVHAGVLWYPTLYDGCIYFIGKGPSAVTVSASSTVVPVGSRVLIQGTITDESAGAKGTPAIADEYMTEWMEYLYMQKPMPTNAKGVPILIQAALPNGTVIEIGWTTSDIMGHYEIEWTPPEPGTYKILATFLGTKSYYPSAAQTAITVTEKAAPAGIEGISTWEAITLTLTIITLIIVVYLAVKTKKQ